MDKDAPTRWQREFERWPQPFLAVLGHTARRRWAPAYLRSEVAFPIETHLTLAHA
jgi:hypothetical protein